MESSGAAPRTSITSLEWVTGMRLPSSSMWVPSCPGARSSTRTLTRWWTCAARPARGTANTIVRVLAPRPSVQAIDRRRGRGDDHHRRERRAGLVGGLAVRQGRHRGRSPGRRHRRGRRRSHRPASHRRRTLLQRPRCSRTAPRHAPLRPRCPDRRGPPGPARRVSVPTWADGRPARRAARPTRVGEPRSGPSPVRFTDHPRMATYGEVIEVQRLTPHMVRVVLGGDGLAEFAAHRLHRPVRERAVRPAGRALLGALRRGHGAWRRALATTPWAPAFGLGVGSGRLPAHDRLRRPRRRGVRRPVGHWGREPGDRLQVVGPPRAATCPI